MAKSRIYIFLLIVTCALGISAKEKEFKVLTHLENYMTRERIDGQVTIMRNDSSIIRDMTVTKWGDTFLPAVGAPGDTVIYRFSAEGYIPVTMNFVIPLKGREPLKKIKQVLLIKERVRELDEVVVKTSKVKMVMKGDTIVYNADAFELANGSMLDALIARLPGAELKDGVIKVNGEYVNELLLNGESFFKGDPSVALQNLPAFTVKNLKVYRKEHESAYLTGETKDKKKLPLVMDVILKRDYATGWIGNAEGGYGIPGERWMGKAFLLGYADNLRITAFGNGNNVNNTTTAGTGGQWSQESDVAGENRIIKEGIDYLFHNKKTPLRFEGNVILGHKRNHTLTEKSARNFIPDGDTWTRSRDNSRARDFSLSTAHTMNFSGTSIFGNVRASFQYTRNRFNELSQDATFSSEPSEKYRVSALDSVFAGIESPELLRKLSYRYADSRNTATRIVTGSLMHSGIVQIPGSMDNLQYAVNGTFSRNHSEGLHEYSTYYPHEPAASAFTNRCQDRVTPASGLDVYANYYQKNVWKHNETNIDVNYGAFYYYKSDTEDNSWYDLTDQVSSRQAVLRSLDPENSFNQRVRTHRPEARMNLNLYTFKYISSERSRNFISFNSYIALCDRLDVETLDYASPLYQTRLSRTSNFLLPTLRLSFSQNHSFRTDTADQWQQGASNSFSLKYEYREGNAPLSYGLDYRRSPNPLNIYIPNHDLRRSAAHNIEFSWQHKGRNQRMMNIYSYLNIRPCALVQARFYDRETGVNTWMPDNISGNWESYIHFRFDKPIDRNRELQFTTTTYWYHDNNVDYVSTSDMPERSVVVSNTPGETVSLSWQHGRVLLKGSFSAELRAVRSARVNFADLDLFYIKPTLEATLPLPGEVQFSTNLNMVKHYGYSDPTLRKAEILWNAEISRSVLDGRLLLKLRAYDILGRVNPNRTVVNAQGVTESFTNTLTRYVMLQLTYNFTRKPKKKDY